METRKITIVTTKSQSKTVIETNATTLAELKRELDIAGIDYSNMTFYEGISRTELKDDNSVLPHDVPYKGSVTNELVFMLTNTNKKITSGNERADLYVAIKNNNLQEAAKVRFGKNYTQCSNADLKFLVDDFIESNAPKCTSPECDLRKALVVLMNTLSSDYDMSEVSDILGVEIDPTKKLTSSYSDDEISSMFDFI